MAEVGITGCKEYRPDCLAAAIGEAVDLIGGITKFVPPGAKVLLKPNLLKKAAPEAAVTTHPEFVRQVIRLVKTQTDEVYLGDSPAGLIRAEEVYEATGMAHVCKQEKVHLVRFDQISKREGIPIARIFEECDVCINLPKLKTHDLTIITAAVKNVFGLVPGLYKVQCHKEHPNFRAFALTLARIYRLAQPHLHIIDAVVAMEGAAGPSAGRPRPVGTVVASADGVAADAVLSEIIGAAAESVPTTYQAQRLHAGEARLDHITVKGLSLDAVRVKDFVLPRMSRWVFRLPNIISRTLLKLVPLMLAADKQLCSGCLMCAKICPEQAIRVKNGRPHFDARRCIMCLCCAEACPENAVYVRLIRRRFKS